MRVLSVDLPFWDTRLCASRFNDHIMRYLGDLKVNFGCATERERGFRWVAPACTALNMRRLPLAQCR